MEKHDFYCSVIAWNCTWSVQDWYSIFSWLNRLLRIRLKRQNPLHSYVREKEKVHCKCTMYCTVHFIITLFNVDNVLLCVIYQLNFTEFMHVTRISRYMSLYSVYSVRYCPRFSVNAVGLGTYYPRIGRSTCITFYKACKPLLTSCLPDVIKPHFQIALICQKGKFLSTQLRLHSHKKHTFRHTSKRFLRDVTSTGQDRFLLLQIIAFDAFDNERFSETLLL